MPQSIFVNLPVADLPRARAFYAGLGLAFDERFSDDTAACVVVSEAIFLMLLTRPRFEGFAPRPVGDPAQATSVLVCLSRESREAVDAFVEAGLGAGGTDNHKVQDLGDAMYARSLSDPDGNVIEVVWMDVARMAPTLAAEIDAAVDA